MKKIIIILFVISTNILYGQNNNISYSVDSLKKCKDSIEHQLKNTENIISDLRYVYYRWKSNNKANILYYTNSTCSVSDGLQDFHIDTNSVVKIKKGTKVIVVQVTPNASKIYHNGKEYFIQTKNLTRQEDYLKAENKIVLNKSKDSLTQQVKEIETLELNEKRAKIRKRYQFKKDSINQQLTEINHELVDLNVTDYYIVTRECAIYLPYQEVLYRSSDYVKDLQTGTEVRVTRYLPRIYAYKIILNGKDYIIKENCLLPETVYILRLSINENTIVKDSLLQKIKKIETKLASIGYGKAYYFNQDCDLYTGQNAIYRGRGNYEMTIPKDTKVIVVGNGIYTNEIVFNGKRYWARSSCLVPEKEYLSELKKKRETRLKDSLAFANPTLYYFKKDGWLCDSIIGDMGNCGGKTIHVKKGTKVYFVKNINTGYSRCIVYYNDKIFYTVPAFLVSEKSILEKKRREKEQEEKRLELNKQLQEYQQARLIRLEKKYGSVIAYKIIKGQIWIGMTDKMVIESIGKPQKINRTVTQNGVTEQWVYNSNVYLYFTDGVLTAWQD